MGFILFDVLALSFSYDMKYGPNLCRIKKKLSKEYFNFMFTILSLNYKNFNILRECSSWDLKHKENIHNIKKNQQNQTTSTNSFS